MDYAGTWTPWEQVCETCLLVDIDVCNDQYLVTAKVCTNESVVNMQFLGGHGG